MKKNNQIIKASHIECPHCQYVFRVTDRFGFKRLGPSYRPCPKCNGMYNDIDYYEWNLLKPTYKFYFYFLANYRFLGFLPMIEFFLWECNWDACYFPPLLIVLSLLWPIICFCYIRFHYKNELIASKMRTQNKEYVELLEQLDQNFSSRYDFYKLDLNWNSLKELIKDAFTFD